MTPIQFWFDFASTYSHLAALRIDSAAAGLEVIWRPFLLGPLFLEQQGLRDSPFNVNQARGRYMWRDLTRESAKYQVPYRRPTVFPRNSTAAARLAVSAAGEPWLPDFCRAVFRANFVDDRDIADGAVLAALLEAVPGASGFQGTEAKGALRARTEEAKGALRARTEEAKVLGLFGAPSFLVDGELFFGNDRLEDAIAAARGAGCGRP